MRSLVTRVLALLLCFGMSAGAAQAAHPWTIPGTLRIGLGSLPNTLDPVLRTQFIESFLASLVFDPLIATRVDGTLEPRLAVTVPTLANGGISRDGLTVTYHLRSGVTWHDGKPFTSDDVKFTALAYADPRNNVSNHIGYENVASVDTPSPGIAIVHLKTKDASLVRTFGALAIVPAHAFDGPGALNNAAFNAAPIGTGPYRFERWVRGDHLEYSANDDYFNGKPKVRKIVVKFLPDESNESNALRTHEIDWMWGPSTVAYDRVRNLPTAKTALIAYNAYFGVAMNIEHKPLDDVRVRQAISSALDRRALVEKVAFGAALEADSDQPRTLGTHGTRPFEQRFDLARSRDLLRQAGFVAGPDGMLARDGKPLSLLMTFGTGGATAQALAVQVQAMLHAVGIAVELKPIDPNQLFAPFAAGGVLQHGNFDLEWSGFFETDDPDDSSVFACRNRPPHGFNSERYCNPKFDALTTTALQTYDPVKRAAIYARSEFLISHDAPIAFIWWPLLPHVFDSDFTGFEERPGVRSLHFERWAIGTP